MVVASPENLELLRTGRDVHVRFGKDALEFALPNFGHAFVVLRSCALNSPERNPAAQ